MQRAACINLPLVLRVGKSSEIWVYFHQSIQENLHIETVEGTCMTESVPRTTCVSFRCITLSYWILTPSRSMSPSLPYSHCHRLSASSSVPRTCCSSHSGRSREISAQI